MDEEKGKDFGTPLSPLIASPSFPRNVQHALEPSPPGPPNSALKAYRDPEHLRSSPIPSLLAIFLFLLVYHTFLLNQDAE